MRLTRLYVARDIAAGALLELPPESGAHVVKVLRMRSGQELILFNGDGREWRAEVAAVRGARVSVAVGEGRAVDREPPLPLTLLQCVPRGDRMDFIVQKATELGIERIVPVLSERSVVRLDAAQAESKAVHWRAVAAGACEQSGRNRLPRIDAPRRLLEHLGAAATPGTRLVLEPDSAPPAGGFSPGGAVEIAIGPEGGFSPDELQACQLAGFQRIGLGPRILRTETAAIAAVVWLQTRFGDMSPLPP